MRGFTSVPSLSKKEESLSGFDFYQDRTPFGGLDDSFLYRTPTPVEKQKAFGGLLKRLRWRRSRSKVSHGEDEYSMSSRNKQ